MGRLTTSLCGIELDNPVIPASGTFGFGYEFAQWYDINCLGTFSFKGTTKDPRFGNPTPRIAECTAGMINSVGLQNPGVEKVIAEELPKLENGKEVAYTWADPTAPDGYKMTAKTADKRVISEELAKIVEAYQSRMPALTKLSKVIWVCYYCPILLTPFLRVRRFLGKT